uniref:Variant surface glycoprotein n=1 Tax=Trypanosoma brucei TaxID=5691 RepID=A0A1V0FYB9_9TRYP|nr:variant surface glycoprotein [Trypanosoma brucei]
MQRLATAALFVVAFLYSTEQAVGSTKANAPCKNACGCKSRLLKRLDLYTSKYNDGISNERRNTEAYAKLVTAALTAVPTMRKKILPLLGAAADILDTCRAELATARPLVQTAMAKVTEAAGVYNTLQKLEDNLGEVKIEFGGSNLNLPVTKFTTKSLGALKQASCTGPDGEPQGLKLAFEHEENEPEPAKLITHGQIDLTCGTGASQNTACHGNVIDNQAHITIGLSFSDTSKDESGQWAAAPAKTKKTIHSNSADFIGDNTTAAHGALKAIRTAGATAPCSSLITDFNAFRNNPKFKLMVIKALLTNRLHRRKATQQSPKWMKRLTMPKVGKEPSTAPKHGKI